MEMYSAYWSAWEHSRRRDLEQLAYSMMENLDDRKQKAIYVLVKYDLDSSTPVSVESATLIEMEYVEKEHSVLYTRFMFALNCVEKHDEELTCCLFVFQVQGAPEGANDTLAIDASVHRNLWEINKPRKSQETVFMDMNSGS